MVRIVVATLPLTWAQPTLAKDLSWHGKVVGVGDGDTITTRREKTQVQIRLQGVDAPEYAVGPALR